MTNRRPLPLDPFNRASTLAVARRRYLSRLAAVCFKPFDSP